MMALDSIFAFLVQIARFSPMFFSQRLTRETEKLGFSTMTSAALSLLQ